MIRFVRLTWDRLSLYLPLILMGLMALGTYWLVKSTPLQGAEVSEEPQRKDPDYLMERFSIKTFDNKGHLKSEIFGEHARHFPYTDILEIDQVRIRSFNSHGHMTTATARRALTNNDASEVQLIGDALVVREAVSGKSTEKLPRLSFSGEFLHAYIDDERIKSHKPVSMMRGNDHITADNLEYSNFDQVMELHGRVRGTLRAPPAN